jgi:hypothetical protein
MILRFHRQIYAGEAVDEAVKRFAAFARFELGEEPDHWVVKLDATGRHPVERIAGELCNYALGATVKRRGTTP